MKTSTGYAEKGASVSDVQLMRKHLPARIKIKASGGIRHYAFAAELIEAGARPAGMQCKPSDSGRRKTDHSNLSIMKIFLILAFMYNGMAYAQDSLIYQ